MITAADSNNSNNNNNNNNSGSKNNNKNNSISLHYRVSIIIVIIITTITLVYSHYRHNLQMDAWLCIFPSFMKKGVAPALKTWIHSLGVVA